MSQELKISEIFDKNVSFLIGAGASFGLLPTLELKIKDAEDNLQTIETIATQLESDNKASLLALLFMHYYVSCIKPAINFDYSSPSNPTQERVAHNYYTFLSTILSMLKRKDSSLSRKVNIFTTNYDGCFESAADKYLSNEIEEFILNDGTRGFIKLHLHAKNYNSYVQKTGVFEKSVLNIPQINLIHMHGCVYWYKLGSEIYVNYHQKYDTSDIDKTISSKLEDFSELLNDETKTLDDLYAFNIKGVQVAKFWEEYRKLPIVNPTKWKFHETVFEQHYYQMLRMMNYELEKPNSIFITFGFSFADEHILQIVQRSLSNPSLELFICCFNESEKNRIESLFTSFDNVKFILLENNLTFDDFNNEVFNLVPTAGG